MSEQKPSRTRRTRGLSGRKARFFRAFVGKANGNATLAATMADYSPKTAKQQGSRLLTSADVARAIADFQRTRATRTIADAKERDEILSAILRDETADVFARIAAAKELNKCSGRHSIKHVLDVTEKLSDIIAGSRGPAIREVGPVGLSRAAAQAAGR